MTPLTSADHLGNACVGIARLASTHHCVGRWMMGTEGIRIASSVLHRTTIYREDESIRSLVDERLTCAECMTVTARIDVARFTGAFDSMTGGMV